MPVINHPRLRAGHRAGLSDQLRIPGGAHADWLHEGRGGFRSAKPVLVIPGLHAVSRLPAKGHGRNPQPLKRRHSRRQTVQLLLDRHPGKQPVQPLFDRQRTVPKGCVLLFHRFVSFSIFIILGKRLISFQISVLSECICILLGSICHTPVTNYPLYRHYLTSCDLISPSMPYGISPEIPCTDS